MLHRNIDKSTRDLYSLAWGRKWPRVSFTIPANDIGPANATEAMHLDEENDGEDNNEEGDDVEVNRTADDDSPFPGDSYTPQPPFYMMAYEVNGPTTSSFLGSQSNSLSWQINHAAGKFLRLNGRRTI